MVGARPIGDRHRGRAGPVAGDERPDPAGASSAKSTVMCSTAWIAVYGSLTAGDSALPG